MVAPAVSSGYSAYYVTSREVKSRNWLIPDKDRFTYNARTVHFFEALQTCSTGTFAIEKGALSPERTSAWLEKSTTRASNAHSSLRILVGHCKQAQNLGRSVTEIPFNSQAFQDVLESFRVRSQFLWYLEHVSDQASRFCGLSSADWSYIFNAAAGKKGFCSTSVSYDSSNRSTCVLLLTHSRSSEIMEHLAALQENEYHAFLHQPVLVPFIVCVAATMHHANKLDSSAMTIRKLEELLGQHSSPHRPKGDPLKVDFLAATTSLNSNSARLMFNEARLEGTLSVLTRILGYSKELDLDSPVQGTETKRFCEQISHLKDYCENMLLQNRTIQRCTNTQIAVVYNFMAQRDMLLNVSLAEDSKAIAKATSEDSSAMRTIAFVTMVFLPPTYIAALFAMPLFQWDVPAGTSVLSERFWYYWAITVPLTILVLTTWVVFDRIKDLWHRVVRDHVLPLAVRKRFKT